MNGSSVFLIRLARFSLELGVFLSTAVVIVITTLCQLVGSLRHPSITGERIVVIRTPNVGVYTYGDVCFFGAIVGSD